MRRFDGGIRFRSNGSRGISAGAAAHMSILLAQARRVRCGLRGVRVGEASIPGPPLSRLRREGRGLRILSVPSRCICEVHAVMSSDDKSLVPGRATGRSVTEPARSVAIWIDMGRGWSSMPFARTAAQERHHRVPGRVLARNSLVQQWSKPSSPSTMTPSTCLKTTARKSCGLRPTASTV